MRGVGCSPYQSHPYESHPYESHPYESHPTNLTLRFSPVRPSRWLLSAYDATQRATILEGGCHKGELTKLGKQQLHELGALLRRRSALARRWQLSCEATSASRPTLLCYGSDLSAVRSYVQQHALLAAELDVSQLYIRTSNMSRTVESGRSARDIVPQRIQSGVGHCSTSKFPIRTGCFAA